MVVKFAWMVVGIGLVSVGIVLVVVTISVSVEFVIVQAVVWVDVVVSLVSDVLDVVFVAIGLPVIAEFLVKVPSVTVASLATNVQNSDHYRILTHSAPATPHCSFSVTAKLR